MGRRRFPFTQDLRQHRARNVGQTCSRSQSSVPTVAKPELHYPSRHSFKPPRRQGCEGPSEKLSNRDYFHYHNFICPHKKSTIAYYLREKPEARRAWILWRIDSAIHTHEDCMMSTTVSILSPA